MKPSGIPIYLTCMIPKTIRRVQRWRQLLPIHPLMDRLTTSSKTHDEDLDTCSREDIQKLISLEVESFQQERTTLSKPHESVHPDPKDHLI